MIPHFGIIGGISLKTEIALILKYQMATLAQKTYYNKKIYDEEVFVKIKSQNVSLIKKSPENVQTKLLAEPEKEKASGMGRLSN